MTANSERHPNAFRHGAQEIFVKSAAHLSVSCELSQPIRLSEFFGAAKIEHTLSHR